MTTDRETTRIVRSWLEEGATSLPDRVLDAVLDQLPATRQRRAWWPARRYADMNLYTKLAIAAAAVLVVAVVGVNLLPGGNAPGVGGPVASPSPSPTSSPSPSPSPARNNSTLPAGTYRLADPAFTRIPFTFTVPDGWRREDNFVTNGGSASDAFGGNGVYIATWLVSHVYGESCRWQGTLRETGAVAALTDALSRQSGHETTGPLVTTVGGRPATRFEFSVPAEFDVSVCDSAFMRLWPDAGPNEDYGLPIAVGQTVTVYVVDLDGQPQLIVAARKDTSPAADVVELEQVVDSIQFE